MKSEPSLLSLEATRRQIRLLFHGWPERRPHQRKLDPFECYLFLIWLEDRHSELLARGQFGGPNLLAAIQAWIGKKGARVRIK